MTRQSFEQALMKGSIGESLVRALLEKAGWIVYQPITDGAHAFDMLSIKDKEKAIAIDVKAKAKMTYFDATGVNLVHFEQYRAFSEKHRMPFWIIFVDESLGHVYGNEIKELEKPRIGTDGRMYPTTFATKSGTKLRLWPISAMRKIADLSEESSEALKSVSQRNYEYEARA